MNNIVPVTNIGGRSKKMDTTLFFFKFQSHQFLSECKKLLVIKFNAVIMSR